MTATPATNVISAITTATADHVGVVPWAGNKEAKMTPALMTNTTADHVGVIPQAGKKEANNSAGNGNDDEFDNCDRFR